MHCIYRGMKEDEALWEKNRNRSTDLSGKFTYVRVSVCFTE